MARKGGVPRPFGAVVCVLWGLSVAQASLIPAGSQVYFSIDSPTLSFGGGMKVLRPQDVLSTAGGVAIGNWDLIKNFAPAGGKSVNAGLGGLQVFQWPSGKGRPQVFFSTESSFFSNALGTQVTPGEVLNKQGQVVASNQQLVAAFNPGTDDNLGLASFDILDPGQNRQIWFSTTSSFHSGKLGQDISPGDILSNTGQIIASNANLLAAFRPTNPSTNYGLDSLYVVDSKSADPVIWFSTTRPFYSRALRRMISAGDLVSNQGQIVATNAELMGQFGFRLPLNSGLDAFTMVRPMNTIDESNDNKDTPDMPEPPELILIALTIPMLLRRRRS